MDPAPCLLRIVVAVLLAGHGLMVLAYFRSAQDAKKNRSPPARHRSCGLVLAAADDVYWLLYIGASLVLVRGNWPFPLLPIQVRAALPLALVGVALVAAALIALLVALGQMGTSFQPAYNRPHAASELVSSGIYRWLRHPIYASRIVSLLGSLLLFQSWVFVLLLLLIPLFVVVARSEEKELIMHFGPRYEKYRARTGAFLPGLAGGQSSAGKPVTLPNEAISRLRCPRCRTSDDLALIEEHLLCSACGSRFPLVFHDLLDFAPVAGARDPRGHAYTYSYSSKLYEPFRTSFLMKVSTGLSFADERALLLESLELATDSAVLDVGCGTGLFTREMAERCSDSLAWGLDCSYSQLERALLLRRRAGLDNLVYVHGLASELPFKDGSMDRVLTVGAMQFFGDHARFFSEVHRVMRAGGLFVAVNYLATAQRTWLRRFVQGRAMARHELFTRQRLETLAAGAGLSVEDYREKELVFVLKARKPGQMGPRGARRS